MSMSSGCTRIVFLALSIACAEDKDGFDAHSGESEVSEDMIAADTDTDSGHTSEAPSRGLGWSEPTVDVGPVAVGSSESFYVYLFNEGPEPITVHDVTLVGEDDTESWELLDSWATDATEDGEDVLVIEDRADLELRFRPSAEGDYRATLTVLSDDPSDLDSGTEIAELSLLLRGVARTPCAFIYPQTVDFGQRPEGGYFDQSIAVANCGQAMLTVTAAWLEGHPSFAVDEDDLPLYVLAGETETLNATWIASAAGEAEGATLTLVSDDPDLTTSVTLVGNDCESSVDTSWDWDEDGWFSCGGDCDDDDADVFPGQRDGDGASADGEDNDCDGEVDEGDDRDADDDGDGYTETEGDCLDSDDRVSPVASERANQIDDDCDGLVDDETAWYDDDGDELSELEGDCDDSDASVCPYLEDADDGLDNNCDGVFDPGGARTDDDGDSYVETPDEGEADCDDDDPWAYPGGREDCDDADNDCDSLVDEGEDDVVGSVCPE